MDLAHVRLLPKYFRFLWAPLLISSLFSSGTGVHTLHGSNASDTGRQPDIRSFGVSKPNTYLGDFCDRYMKKKIYYNILFTIINFFESWLAFEPSIDNAPDEYANNFIPSSQFPLLEDYFGPSKITWSHHDNREVCQENGKVRIITVNGP